MNKQPPRWFLAICGIGFILTLILEIVSFSHVQNGSADEIGQALGSDFIGAICWLLPAAIWEKTDALWGRMLATILCFLLALTIVYVNLRAMI